MSGPSGDCAHLEPIMAERLKAYKARNAPHAYATMAAENARMRKALREVRAAITGQNGLNDEFVVCTVWVSEIETAVDCIDAALAWPPPTGVAA